jgi:hypothetical protein
MAKEAQPLEATRPAAATPTNAQGILSVLLTVPLPTQAGVHPVRGAKAVDTVATAEEPATPIVLALPLEQRVV